MKRRRDSDDEQMAQYSQLLKMDAQAVVKAVEVGDPFALRAIVNHLSHEAESRLPESFYLELFTACCVHADEKKYRQAFVQRSSADKDALAVYERTIDLATNSLSLIGSSEMAKAIENCEEDLFTPSIIHHWEGLFAFMNAFYELSRQADLDAGRPCRNSPHSSLLCNAMSVLFSCEALGRSIKNPALIFESTWAWCLYGHNLNERHSTRTLSKLPTSPVSGVRCLFKLYDIFREKGVFAEAAVKGSSAYGGLKFISLLSIGNFLACTLSKRVDELRFYVVPLEIFYEAITESRATEEDSKLGHKFINLFDEQGGMGSIFKGLSFLAKAARSQLMDPKNEETLVVITMLVEDIFDRGRRHVERAARDGILEFFLVLDPDREGVADILRGDAIGYLEKIQTYLVYYSVIEAYATEMRRFTDGTDPKERCLTKGKFFNSWQKTKRLLLERYCAKSFYDLVIIPDRQRHCNSCGKSEGENPFSTCGNCRRVLYCSKQCQLTDWKEDGHREDCQAKIHRYNNDIPFLCFLANMYLTSRYPHLLQNLGVPLENAVFQIWFSLENGRPKLSVAHTDRIEQVLSGRLSLRFFNAMDPKLVVRGGVHTSPPPVRDARTGKGTIPGPGAQIMIEVIDGENTYVMRYVSFQPDARVVKICDSMDVGSYWFGNREKGEIRMTPMQIINESDAGLLGLVDFVDYIYSLFYAPGEDPWALHLREDGPRKHVLDFIDDVIKEKIVADPEGLESGAEEKSS